MHAKAAIQNERKHRTLSARAVRYARVRHLQALEARRSAPKYTVRPLAEIFIKNGDAHLKKNQVGGEAGGDFSCRVDRDLWAFSFGLT